MRALALASLLLLGACVAYTRPYEEPVPPTPPPAQAPPTPPPAQTPPAPPARPPPAPAGYISERQAVDIAFQICRDRGLAVEAVRRARLDGSGRWHVDLRGRDRARLLLDARDGRLLKGKFQQRGGPREDEEWDG